ncbi:MAG: TIM barrel protein [Ardenticatenales bacterium]|nr:TIM barrel protein [Ardenticatenales bacterium]
MTSPLLIGISGAPDAIQGTGSAASVRACRALGIDALELAWVHSVSVKPEGGAKIRAAAESMGVRLSVHAPYYINLNSPEPDKVEASIGRIVLAARGAAWVGARNVVLHLGFYHTGDRADVYARMRDGLLEALSRIADADDIDPTTVCLRPELMGRASQFGDLDEVLRLCQDVPGIAPCLDVAHWHARTGAWNTAHEFESFFRAVRDALGPAALQDLHIHISGIAYGPLGEKKHLPFAEADLDVRAFLEVATDMALAGTAIVESPERERDVLWLIERQREARGTTAGGSEQTI